MSESQRNRPHWALGIFPGYKGLQRPEVGEPRGLNVVAVSSRRCVLQGHCRVIVTPVTPVRLMFCCLFVCVEWRLPAIDVHLEIRVSRYGRLLNSRVFLSPGLPKVGVKCWQSLLSMEPLAGSHAGASGA